MRPVFYVASRGHHADIGGITPGSMPPHSTSLQQEGAVFLSFKLVQGGVFQEEGERQWVCGREMGSVDWHTWLLPISQAGYWDAAHRPRPASRLGVPGSDISQR